MSSLSSSVDTDAPSLESLEVPSSSTAPSSITSEPAVSTGSPFLNPLTNDAPTPKVRLDSTGDDDKLASREPVASVPHDFPGKRTHFASTIPKGGNFEADKHFYARCCTSL